MITRDGDWPGRVRYHTHNGSLWMVSLCKMMVGVTLDPKRGKALKTRPKIQKEGKKKEFQKTTTTNYYPSSEYVRTKDTVMKWAREEKTEEPQRV